MTNKDNSEKTKNIPLKDLLKKKKKSTVKEIQEDEKNILNKKKIVIKKKKEESKPATLRSGADEENKKKGNLGTTASDASQDSRKVQLISSSDYRGQNRKKTVSDVGEREGPKRENDARGDGSKREVESGKGEVDLSVSKTLSPEKKVEAGVEGGERGKKKVKEKDQRKESWKSKKEREQEEKLNKVFVKKKNKADEVQVPSIPKEIEILETVSVGDLAKKLNIKASEVIGHLMKMGMMTTINQILDSDTAILLANEMGANVKIVSLYDETLIEEHGEDRAEDSITRPPVVTIMGHVDHGKTKLLDSIRASNIVDGESGGITQHIGAYQVNVNNKKVTFLDTPGHEAFTLMRSRGASITDIVILVVAADDGVMPQTIEAINHAKEAKVPIIVAINKMDLEGANPEKIKQELAGYDLVSESWGGKTIYVEISAKEHTNIDQLLEMILLQAEILELKANPQVKGKGTIIESKLDQGRGPVVSVLIQKGTLRIGDPFVAGVYSGKVRALFNDLGEKVDQALPSDPVEIIGLSGVPESGDPFEVVESERYAKQICQKRQELKRHEESKNVQKVTLEHLNEMIAKGVVKELKVIIKADVHGSAEALKDSLENLSNDQITVKCIHAGTGAINESDVLLASTSNALIIGFHVRPNLKASEIANRENVDMKFYNIIYNVVDDIKGAMEGMLDPELREQSEGKGEIREVFKISKVGTIAGAFVISGKIGRNHKIRLIRDGEIVYDGSFRSLKRFKDDLSEVQAGFECGFSLENFNDIQDGDHFETYEMKQIKQILRNNK